MSEQNIGEPISVEQRSEEIIQRLQGAEFGSTFYLAASTPGLK
jgi:hypothetical protein